MMMKLSNRLGPKHKSEIKSTVIEWCWLFIDSENECETAMVQRYNQHHHHHCQQTTKTIQSNFLFCFCFDWHWKKNHFIYQLLLRRFFQLRIFSINIIPSSKRSTLKFWNDRIFCDDFSLPFPTFPPFLFFKILGENRSFDPLCLSDWESRHTE